MRSILLSACTLFGTAFVALSVHAFGDVYFFLLLLAAMLVGIASILPIKKIRQTVALWIIISQ